jgi:outer membrane protein
MESAERREARGLIGQSDRLQAATALAKATLEKNRALGAYRKALSVLVYAMGVPAEAQITLPDEPEAGPAREGRDLGEWMDRAAKNHPAIAAARAQLEAARQRVAAARSEGLPTIDFAGNYYQNGYPGQGLLAQKTRVSTLGVTLTIPLFDGFSTTYKIRGAQAQAGEREADLRDAEHRILTDVIKAHADAASALLNMESSEALLKAAGESLASSQRRYDKGAANILEILNAQGALADAWRERIRCLAEWRSARLRLLAAAGMLGRSGVNE